MGLLAALLGAILIGWLVTNDYLLYAAGLVGILAASLIVSRVYFLLWSTIFVGIVISGLAKLYTPALQQIRWLLIPLSLLLAIHAVREVAIDFRDGTQRSYSPLVYWALVFLLLMIGVTLINDTEINRVIVGFKGYFQVWGLFFALALIPWSETTIDRIPRVLFFVAILQIPFVLHQYLFLVPMRAGLDASRIVEVDVIAGTFGASAEGGGANALLVAFQFIVFWGLVSARISNVISTRFLVLFSIPILFPAFVNMAKVAVIYALLGFLVLFATDFFRRPREFLLAGIGALVLSSLLLTAMTLNAPEHASVESWKDLIEFTYSYNVEQEELGTHLSRFGSVAYWAEHHGSRDWFHSIFGHGMGFTRVADTRSAFQDSIAVSQQGVTFEIDLSQDLGIVAIAALLWEGGVLSLMAVFGLIIYAFLAAGRLANLQPDHPERAAALRACQVAMAIYAVTFMHNNMFVFHVGQQTLFMLILGYIAYWDTRQRTNQSLGAME